MDNEAVKWREAIASKLSRWNVREAGRGVALLYDDGLICSLHKVPGGGLMLMRRDGLGCLAVRLIEPYREARFEAPRVLAEWCVPIVTAEAAVKMVSIIERRHAAARRAAAAREAVKSGVRRRVMCAMVEAMRFAPAAGALPGEGGES